MSDESRESLEDVRMEKLRKIAELGIDPWGQRFDGHRAIRELRASAPPNDPEKEPAPGPMVRVAGRIMLRRGQGKVNFLQIGDWSGRLQVMIGQKQVGEIGCKLA